MKRLVKRLVGTPSSGACPKRRTREVRDASVLPPSRDPACSPPHETLSRCAAAGRRTFLARRVHSMRNTRPALPQQQHHRARAQRLCRSAARRASPTAPPACRARASSSAAWRVGGARVRREPGQPGSDTWAHASNPVGFVCILPPEGNAFVYFPAIWRVSLRARVSLGVLSTLTSSCVISANKGQARAPRGGRSPSARLPRGSAR